MPGILNVLLGKTSAAGATLSKSFVAATTNTGDGSSHTYSGHNIGTAASDRTVVVVATAHDGNGTSGLVSVSGITIGGVSATSVVSQSAGTSSNNSCCVGIYKLLVTSGTTADIVVSYSKSVNRGRISVYTITGATTLSNTNTGTASGTQTLSATITGATGAVIIAGASAQASAAISATWTGATEDDDANPEASSIEHTSASTTGAGGTVECALSVAVLTSCSAFAGAAFTG